MDLKKYSGEIDKIQSIYNSKFNIFKVLKQEEYENRHSNFLSWLFNIKASHGFGSKFANKFFNECFGLGCTIDANTIESVKVEVRTDGEEERKAGKDKCRIDILIIGEKFTCTIENKYGSFEHNGQCSVYQDYVERKYVGIENKFVFLDIEKPKDFDTNKSRYRDFVFVSYKQIKEILDELIGKFDKTERLEISFIRQYIELLEEKYQPLQKDVLDVCSTIDINEVMKISEISDKEYKELTEDEKVFVRILRQYQKSLKEQNDSMIFNILSDIVNDVKKDINSNYGSGKKSKNKTIRYAYAINVPKKIFPNEEKFLESVDYTAIGELKMAILAGLSGQKSKALIETINANTFFWKNIEYLSKKGWCIKVVYRVGGASNYLNKDSHLICKIECDWKKKDLFTSNMISKYVVYRVPKIDTIKVVNEKIQSVKECIDNLEKVGIVDVNAKKEIFKGIDEKCKKGICAGWCIELIYPLGIDIISEKNKKFIIQLYREKAIEGLNLFCLGDKFAKECFQKQ